MTLAVEENKETAVGERTGADERAAAVEVESPHGHGRPGGGEGVARVVVDELDAENRLEDVLRGDLALVEDALVLAPAGLGRKVRLRDGAADDREGGVRTLSGELVADERVEPARGDGVLFERLELKELDQVLDRRPEVATNAELLEGDDHVLPRLATILAVREDVTELRVREFVQTTGAVDGEVTPYVRARAEVELLERTRRRLEPCVGVLRGDTDGDDVTLGARAALVHAGVRVDHVEVDLRRAVWRDAIQLANVLDAVEGDTHRNLQLGSGKVDAGDHLRGRMLDLETGVKLQEIEHILRVAVEVYDGYVSQRYW